MIKDNLTIVHCDKRDPIYDEHSADQLTMAFDVSLSRSRCHLRAPNLVRSIIEGKPYNSTIAQWNVDKVSSISFNFDCSKCGGESLSHSPYGIGTSSSNWERDDPADLVTPLLSDLLDAEPMGYYAELFE